MFVLFNTTIGNINLMPVTIKTAEEIEKMRVAGKLASQVLDMIIPHVVPGVTTNELNDICHNYIVNDIDAIPAPLNYGNPPFPKSVCTSVNAVICHGIPSDKKLKKGDAVNIDVTIIKDGYHGDTSRMYHVGDVAPPVIRLSHIAQVAMYIGIDMVKPGARLGDIGHAIQTYAESNHTSVVREYCGHGIGAVFHEEPQVLHYGKPNTGLVLKEGMTFTIEPMINLGKKETRLLGDSWTVVTKDRSLSAQWEHTILVTETGYEILTLRAEEENWQALLPK
jgi:methionyl aminopeptidase